MGIKSYLVLLLSFFSFVGCQTGSESRAPQSLRKPTSVEDLILVSRSILQEVQNPAIFNSQTCHSYIDSITTDVYKLPTSFFIPKTPQEIANFKNESKNVVKVLFQTRVELKQRLQEFDSNNNLPSECTVSIREANQYIRFAEEYVMEWMADNGVISINSPDILTQIEPYTLVNSKYENFKLQTGDVFLIRGKAFVSAMIARMGDEEGNFSHLAVIGEDSKGNKFAVESLIQQGLIVTPLEPWLKSVDARVALYRTKDQDLAKRAGREIYEHANKYIKNGQTAPYDFSMNDDDSSQLFCSEAVQLAYRKASNGKFILPKFRTTATKFNRTSYFKDMGIRAGSLFAPSDIEVDPRFDFVAEYRHLKLVAQVRMQDSVLQSVYDWMIKDQYEFHPVPEDLIKGFIAKVGRQFGLFKDKLPKHMPQKTLRTIMKYEAIAGVMEDNVYKKNAEYRKENGFGMSFMELMKVSKDYRDQDCKLQKEYFEKINSNPFKESEKSKIKTSEFHWFFHKPKHQCAE